MRYDFLGEKWVCDWEEHQHIPFFSKGDFDSNIWEFPITMEVLE
tara:strand:+ start:1739 stop:1870 length:132 start_codon:yes stop_codon:yes gene_type:complete